MLGYRKLIMFALLLAVAAFVDITATQADVLIALAITGLGSNAAVHGVRSLSEAMVGRSAERAGSRASDSVREASE